MMQFTRLLTLSLVFGCSQTTLTTPLGSGNMTTSPDGRVLYIANSVHNSIARFEPETGALDHIEADGEPTRIARVDDRLFVSLRAKRSVAVFDGASGIPTRVGSIEVGAEPYGVVGFEGTDRIYVSVSLEDAVVEIDATTLEVLRRFTVPGEPRGLAIHPNGNMLFVVGSRSGRLYQLDLSTTAAVPTPIPLPVSRNAAIDVAMTLRLTGDPAVAPDGRLVFVPGLYVRTTTPIRTTTRIGSDYVQSGQPTPVVIAVPIDEHARVEPREAAVISVIDRETDPRVAGYPTGVAVSPDGVLLAVAIEGADAVVVVEAQHSASPASLLKRAEDLPVVAPDWRFFGGRHAGFEPRPVSSVGAPSGPQSILFTDNRAAWAYGFLDRAVARLDIDAVDPSSKSIGDGVGVRVLSRPNIVEVAPSALPPNVEQGRREFYSATSVAVTQPGSGVSCAMCHFDGRDDGISWTFDIGRRQTPSLAGVVSMTEPVRWEGQRATVADNTMATAQRISGTTALTERAAENIAAFIDWTRAPDVRGRTMNEDDRRRGRAVFEEVGCATCHVGPAFTDNEPYPMLGLREVRTRSLVGVSATAPYFHDGSATTLGGVIRRASTGAMGAAFTISDGDRAALEAYLESL